MFLDSDLAEDEPSAYQHIMVELFDDGSALVRTETNDNLDQGYPNQTASWEHQWPDAKLALKHVGFSRIGVSGIRVRVYVNGVERVFQCDACDQSTLF